MAQIKKWEIWGAIVSIFLGSALHFVYGWSGQAHFVALFGAVNESTWEHLKIGFWPPFIIAILEWFYFGRKLNNFCLATFVKLFSIPVIIIVMFYGWLAFFPDNFIWDISVFVFAIFVSYFLSYRILKSKKSQGFETIWTALIIVIALMFSLFTYYPPHSFLTRDPVEGDYGIGK